MWYAKHNLICLAFTKLVMKTLCNVCLNFLQNIVYIACENKHYFCESNYCPSEWLNVWNINTPQACTIKHYGFVIYGLHSNLVCLFVQASVYLSKPKVTSTKQNLSNSRKLSIRNVLCYSPLDLHNIWWGMTMLCSMYINLYLLRNGEKRFEIG